METKCTVASAATLWNELIAILGDWVPFVGVYKQCMYWSMLAKEDDMMMIHCTGEDEQKGRGIEQWTRKNWWWWWCDEADHLLNIGKFF